MRNRMEKRRLACAALVLAGLTAALAVGLTRSKADDVDARVLAAEKKRAAVIEKVAPAVVAVMTGGGSGVLIDDEGYALTNFHVVAAARSPFMKCGLPDGVLYDAVLVGLDKVGDVALIKLLPKKDKSGKIVAPAVKGQPVGKFPFARLGDSDKLQAGDWSLAMGNPFLLATDFTPTVTFGLISGVHRYQEPAGILLEYTDCIQIDTSINPGNSGGPLFNMDAELIGINGRGSFEKRGRVNSGVGYAISINQIKNFLGQLRVGMDTDHASLGALVEPDDEEAKIPKMVVKRVIASDALRRGLDVDDELRLFGGRDLHSVNEYKNILGLYPRGWRVPLSFIRKSDKGTERKDVLVRLMGVQRQEITEGDGSPKPGPGPGPRPRPVVVPGAAAKLFQAKQGYANYYFNKLAQDRLLTAFQKRGDFSAYKGSWKINTTGLKYAGAARPTNMVANLEIKEKGARDGKNEQVRGFIDGIEWTLEPLVVGEKGEAFNDPPDSGGLLLATYQYRQLLTLGRKGFVSEVSHGGIEPFYPPRANGAKVPYKDLRVDAEVLRTRHAGVSAKWYFSTREATRGQLLGFEVWPDRDRDPCEVYLSDYRAVAGAGGGELPHRIEIHYSDKIYAVLNVTGYKLEKK
jgi:serine protease Do